MVLRRLAAVDSLRLMLGAAGVVQAVVASPLRSMRGEEHCACHRQVSAVLHSLVAEPALRVFMAGLGLREWLLDVVRWAARVSVLVRTFCFPSQLLITCAQQGPGRLARRTRLRQRPARAAVPRRPFKMRPTN